MDPPGLLPQDTRVSVLEEEQNDGAWALPFSPLMHSSAGSGLFWIPSAVKLFYWEERLGLTPSVAAGKVPHSLDWSVASAKCLVTDPDAEEAGEVLSCWSEQLWCEWARAFFPVSLCPQDRYHRDVWWEALSARVQVTQEAVLLIDSRFGFF